MPGMDAEQPIPAREDARVASWVALLRANAAVTEAVEAELMASHDLPLSWHEVLVRLSRAPEGSMRMQELAREVLLSKSGLTRLADRMEEAGLIERAKCGTDRRGTYAVITERGRSVLLDSFPAFTSAVDQHFARHLSPTELETLHALLGKVLEGAGKAADEDCLPADAASDAAARVG
jgi:DNA-binding MarR family transcriptional regulator